MTLLQADQDARASSPPDIEVLIKEARRRQRRRQAAGGVVVLALAGVGVGIGFGFSGGGSGGGGGALDGAARGGHGGGSASAPSGTAALLRAVALPQVATTLSLQGRRLAVTMAPASLSNGCRTEFLSPATLARTGPTGGCSQAPRLPPSVASKPEGTGDQVRLRLTTHPGAKARLGSVLFTLDNWDWAHSGAVQGAGVVWIYELGPFGHRSSLLEVSAHTGKVVEHFHVAAGADPFMKVDADGFWITASAYGGSSCAHTCTLWHVAPGSRRIVAQRSLGVRTQWLMASGHSIYADVLAGASGHGYSQTIWRLDGNAARVVYRTPARLLPSTDFEIGTGYVVIGNPAAGYFTLSQLGHGRTPASVGSCDRGAPIRVVRIDPVTGAQSYAATLPRSDAGSSLDCHLSSGQAVFRDHSFYVLTEQLEGGAPSYAELVKLPT
jgi:hypothetical protein